MHSIERGRMGECPAKFRDPMGDRSSRLMHHIRHPLRLVSDRSRSWLEPLCKSQPCSMPSKLVLIASGLLSLCLFFFFFFSLQHMGEYSVAMIIGAGIGATPVSSTLKSIVFYKWRVNMGECFPQHAYFAWVCAHRTCSFQTLPACDLTEYSD